jgi:NADH:ubiquinone oxidoreductase subunit
MANELPPAQSSPVGVGAAGRKRRLDIGARRSHSPARKTARRQEKSAMKWLAQTFTWWNEQTLNTRFYTWLHGERVGDDQFGNIYYRTKGGKLDPALGFERRWVIFNGESEGSKTPPGWYGWLHHTTDVPPTAEDYKPRGWEKPYTPNQTGTPNAWRPQGSTLSAAHRPQATGDYQPWSPEA